MNTFRIAYVHNKYFMIKQQEVCMRAVFLFLSESIVIVVAAGVDVMFFFVHFIQRYVVFTLLIVIKLHVYIFNIGSISLEMSNEQNFTRFELQFRFESVFAPL